MGKGEAGWAATALWTGEGGGSAVPRPAVPRGTMHRRCPQGAPSLVPATPKQTHGHVSPMAPAFQLDAASKERRNSFVPRGSRCLYQLDLLVATVGMFSRTFF